MNLVKVSAIDHIIGIIWERNSDAVAFYRKIKRFYYIFYIKFRKKNSKNMIHRGFNREKGANNSRNIRSNRVSSETLLSSRESKLGDSKTICSGKKIVDSCGSGWY